MKHSVALPALGAFLLLLAAGETRAHEPREGTAVARLQHGRLELTVVMSPQMGSVLAGENDPEAEAVHAGNFSAYQPRLRALAAGLFEVQAGDTRLAAERATVTLNKLGEPEFSLFYPPPKAWPLRLRGAFLSRLPAGYSGSVEVFDENETLLGRRALTRSGAGAELVIAAAASAPAIAGTPTPSEPPPTFWEKAPASPASAPAPVARAFPWTPAIALLAALTGCALLWPRGKTTAKSAAKS